jgi:DHA2 family multidrug resistance protein-like MFS transporter
MATLDASIANIALPTIAHDVHASPAGSIWVVNAYQIGIVMTLLSAAAIGEIKGYRPVYMFGIVLFTVASLGCAMSDSLPLLTAARFVQGFGAACIFGINAALVRFIHPRAKLARGMSYNAMTAAISSAIGPSVAAVILSIASWRWLFAVNLPVGVLALVIGARTLPHVRTIEAPFDLISALLNAAAFALGFLALDNFAHGSSDAGSWVMLAISVVTGLMLVRRLRMQERPLLPLDLLRIATLRLSYATSACSFAAQTALLVALPFYFRDRFHFDPIRIGLLITPLPLGVASSSLLIRFVIEHAEAGLLGGIGLAIMALSVGVLAMVPPGTATALIAIPMAFAGFGFGLFQTPNNRTMLSLAPIHRSGAAAGMLATARLVGQASSALAVSLMFRLIGTVSTVPILFACGLAAVGAMFSLRRLSR